MHLLAYYIEHLYIYSLCTCFVLTVTLRNLFFYSPQIIWTPLVYLMYLIFIHLLGTWHLFSWMTRSAVHSVPLSFGRLIPLGSNLIHPFLVYQKVICHTNCFLHGLGVPFTYIRDNLYHFAGHQFHLWTLT